MAKFRQSELQNRQANRSPMLPQKIFIDANLLVLLVVGETGRELISKHRRLDTFREEDYDSLVRLINAVDQILVTPNTLTEASNLLAQHRDPEKSEFLMCSENLSKKNEEVVVRSQVAVRNREFKRLGLTDAALLEVVSPSNPLVTVDFNLYLAATAKEINRLSTSDTINLGLKGGFRNWFRW